MRALYTTAPGEYGLTERPVPEPGFDDVLIRVDRAGFCVNDLRIRTGVLSSVNYPVIPGHQYAGIIEECGPGVRYVKPGDRVAAHSYVLCGQCASCRKWGMHDCERFENLGFTLDGGLAQFNVAPARCAVQIPDRVSLEEGSLLENLANAIAAVRRSYLRTGERVVVIGATPIGLLTLQVTRLSSPSALVLVGSGKGRLQLAAQMTGARTIDVADCDTAERLREALDSRGADAVLVCAYTRSDLELAVDIVSSGGRIVVEGHYAPTSEVTLAPHRVLVGKAATLSANRGWATPDYQRGLELVSDGIVNMKSIVTHTYPLERWEEAFDVFASPESDAVHVAIAPND